MENKRLTGKWKDDYIAYNSTNQQCLNKLGELEDLDEELDFQLEILGKVIKKEYVVVEDEKGELVFKLAIIKNKKIWIKWKGKECYLPIEDYKKTWWLRGDKSE